MKKVIKVVKALLGFPFYVYTSYQLGKRQAQELELLGNELVTLSDMILANFSSNTKENTFKNDVKL